MRPALGNGVEQSFRVVGVPISRYTDGGFADIDADATASRVVDALTPYGGCRVPWDPVSDRDESWIGGRLLRWAPPSAQTSEADEGSSVLFWVGHGESTGEQAWLATAGSVPLAGVKVHLPEQLANSVLRQWRLRQDDPGAWAWVVVEACGAERFIELLDAACNRDSNAPKRIAFIAAGGKGTSFLGRFDGALRTALANGYTDNDPTIKISDLVARIEEYLGPDAGVIAKGLAGSRPLRRPPDMPPVTATQDAYQELRALLSALPPDQRSHFVPKAQGADQGELPWYFVGRVMERKAIATWLRDEGRGLLTVTGAAGSGKSALLGNVLVYTTPPMCEQLIRHGYLAPLSEFDRPPDDVFTSSILLTGMSTPDLLARLAADAGLPDLPADLELSGRIEWLLQQLTIRQGGVTVLADALDEAQDPFAAASVLRRISALPACRVVVGTRRSTNEGPDLPDPADENLLDALGGAARLRIISVERDPDAVAEYVRRRLQRGNAPAGRIAAAASTMAARNRQFLYARLAIHEILARPDLLDDDHRDELTDLLERDHRALFATAIRRLEGVRIEHRYLLEGLAHTQGRGLPRADRIWATVASAIGHDHPITETDIDQVLADAAPYITLDGEHGHSVYRLAHRTFQEHFLAGDGEVVSVTRRRVANALLSVATLESGPLNVYLASYLGEHVAIGELWPELGVSPLVIDRLQIDELTATVMRHAFGLVEIPTAVAAAVVNRDVARSAGLIDRAILRLMGLSRLEGSAISTDLSHSGGLIWSRRWRRDPITVPLAGHTGTVTGVAAVPLPDGRTLLATTSNDRTVRLWDPTTATPVGKPLTGHTDTVTGVAAVPLPDGRTLLATTSNDRTVRLWDPTTATPVGKPLTGHTDTVTAVAAVPLPDGRTLLATTSNDRTVRLWDPTTATPVGKPLTGHTDTVTAVAAVPLPDGRTLLATTSNDRTVRLWDPTTATPVGKPLTGHTDTVTAVAAVPLPDGRTLLATTSNDQTVWLWDPATSDRVHLPQRGLMTRLFRKDGRLTGHRNVVTAAAAVPLPDGRTLLATTSYDNTVRLWDPISGMSVSELSSHINRVTAVAAIPLPDGRTLLATTSNDHTVRLWDPATATPVGDPTLGHSDSVTGVTAVTLSSGHTVIATTSFDGTLGLWNPDTGAPTRAPLVGPTDTVSAVVVPGPFGYPLLATTSYGRGIRMWNITTGSQPVELIVTDTDAVTALAAVSLPDGSTLLATTSGDHTVRLRDLTTAAPVGNPLTGHTDTVTGLAEVSLSDGSTLLATTSDDHTVRLWDPTTATPVGNPLTGHTAAVNSVAALPLPDGSTLLATTSDDHTVRLWDPSTASPVGNPLTGHTAAVNSVAALPLPDGSTLLATTSDDHTARLWDPVIRNCVRSLPLMEAGVGLVVVAHRLAIATSSGLLMFDFSRSPDAEDATATREVDAKLPSEQLE